MLRKALLLAILSVSTPAFAAESDTGSGGGTGMSILAFVILFAGLSRLVVPEKPEEN